MAYNALNNLIDAYIYANGVQAITGQILNGVLKQMVSQLGSGYHLMGVAGPETVPEQNDFAMAYFAATAGEYIDFGGITLAAGEVAVLLTSGNGSWSKQTVYNVPTGTEDLENTAGFITNAVTDLVNYYTKTEVDTTLENYPNLSDLAAALDDYYDKSEIDAILTGYTTNTALASALADYYNKNDIDGLLSVVNAALADRYTKSETDTKLGDYYKKTETYDKDEVDSLIAALSRQEYIVAWDGLAAPDVSAIPAGVTVTYSGTPYTGTLAASASTVNKIYMVWNGTAYDMYGTSQDGGYSWVPMGTTSVDLSQYATKAELSQLQQEVTADISQLEAKVDDLSTGKYYGYFAQEEDLPEADVDGFAYVGEGPTYTIYNCVGGVWTSSDVTVNQSPIGNEEDIDQNEDGKLQFANRVYNAQQPNGMGYKILRKDATFASQVTDTNTIYEIRYDFSLENTAVTIPSGCILRFDGGSITNGTIHFNGCYLEGDWDKGIQCYADGSIRNDVAFPEMFAPDSCTDWSPVIDAILANNDNIVFRGKTYNFNTSISVAYSNKTISGEDGTLLQFYGNGDFIKVGFTNDYSRYITIRDLVVKAMGSVSSLISIVSASNCSFINVTCSGNNMCVSGFGRPSTCYHTISSLFVNCRVWDSQNGFVFQYGAGKQVNDVTFVNCGCGRISKSGLVVNGCGIRVVGGDYSNTGDYGILVDGYTRAMNICGTYHENNSKYSIYITNSDVENVTVENVYTYNNKAYCQIDKFLQIRKKIVLDENAGRKIYELGLTKISTPGDTPEEAFCEISGTKLPCKVNLRFSSITSGSYLFTVLGLYINGKAYQLNTDCEVKQITAKIGNTVTLDSALSASYSYRVNVLHDNPLLKLIGGTELQTLGMCLMTTDNYQYVGEVYTVVGVSGATAGVTSLDINDSSLNVGDYIAFTNAQRGARLNGNSISISAANTTYSQTQAMPAIASSLPKGLRDSLCVLFYITNDIKNYTVDYLSAYTINE